MFRACKEMVLLRIWLWLHRVEYIDTSDYIACRTWFMYRGKEISVINGLGTTGGLIGLTNAGFLEMMIENRKPKGWLTAKDVVKEIKNL